jgi:hypothetical protein
MNTFDEYVARKEAEAARAVLSPFVTEVDQPPPEAMPVGNMWTRRMFDGPFYVSASPSNDPGTDLPSTSLVFVRSRDGNTGAADPSSLGGGEADKHLIYEGLSRVAADAVMAGAETVAAAESSCRSGIPNWSRCARRCGCRDIRFKSSRRFAGSISAAGCSTPRSCASSSSRSARARS